MESGISHTWNRLENLMGSEGPRVSGSGPIKITRTRINGRKLPILGLSENQTPMRSYSVYIDKSQRPRTATPKIDIVSLPGITITQLQKIYKAKCYDLNIPLLPEQLRRFLVACQKNLINRRFMMMDSGLGTESAKVIGEILKNSNMFGILKLGKNAMGDSGSVIMVRSILKNINYVELDLSSNDISPEGSRAILSMLVTHPSIVSLDLSSHEGLHRNRIGVRGAEPLRELLTVNPILAFLNIQGTSLSYEGVITLSRGLMGNKILISLNLSSNNLGARCMEALTKAVSNTNLQELYLASNKLGNDGCDYLADLISGSFDTPCPLKKLDISKNDIVGKGGQKLFNALRVNSSVKEIALNYNTMQLASVGFLGFLTDNSYLEVLSMAGCEVRAEGSILFNEGLCKNKKLRSLNLSNNYIDDEGAEYIATGLSRNGVLKTLDLSSNKIMNQGGKLLATALRSNKSLEQIILKDNDLHDEAGQLFAEVSRFCHNITKVVLSLNPINLKYIKEVKSNMQNNKSLKNKNKTPELKNQLISMQIGEDAFDRIYIEIERKKKEQEDASKRFEKQSERLDSVKAAEEVKYLELKNEHDGMKQKNVKISEEVSKQEEQIKFTRIYGERDIKNNNEKIAVIASEIKSKEKQRSHIKEEYALKRSQAEHHVYQLQNLLKHEQMVRKNAEQGLVSLKRRLDDLLIERRMLINPGESKNDEAKEFLISEKLASSKKSGSDAPTLRSKKSQRKGSAKRVKESSARSKK